jgi:hypothetical protein
MGKLSHHQYQGRAKPRGFSFHFSWKVQGKTRRFLLNLQDFDDMTEESGVTSAFLFTNFAILLKAKAIVRRFQTLFAQRC